MLTFIDRLLNMLAGEIDQYLVLLPVVSFLVFYQVQVWVNGFVVDRGYIPPTLETIFPPLLGHPVITFVAYALILDCADYLLAGTGYQRCERIDMFFRQGTRMTTKTPWFPAHIKPLRKGLYETAIDLPRAQDGIIVRCFWDGTRWLWGETDKPALTNERVWRGLSRDPR